jgi:hypothetical protein
MSEQNWKPLLRTPTSTLTKVVRSPAFLHARERAASIIESPVELRALADLVQALDQANAPLSAVADRVSAAVRFLRTTADRLERDRSGATSGQAVAPRPESHMSPAASVAARQRLVVAGLHYLITADDLVPDFRAGGYLDDVLLLSWVFGAAVNELAPHLVDDSDAGDTVIDVTPS